jgi:hypothetical protein
MNGTYIIKQAMEDLSRPSIRNISLIAVLQLENMAWWENEWRI